MAASESPESTSAESAPAGAASDDVKRKFREALDRKKQTQHDRPGHLEGESSVHGAQGKAGAKRQFRRKSGG